MQVETSVKLDDGWDLCDQRRGGGGGAMKGGERFVGSAV